MVELPCAFSCAVISDGNHVAGGMVHAISLARSVASSFESISFTGTGMKRGIANIVDHVRIRQLFRFNHHVQRVGGVVAV